MMNTAISVACLESPLEGYLIKINVSIFMLD